MSLSQIQIWSSPQWRAEAEAWIGQQLHKHSLRLIGEIEQPRLRAWSTHLKVPTDQGMLWFKENAPAHAFEAALIDAMATFAPDHVVVPIAVESERGWLLSPDQGVTLRTLEGTNEAMWCRLVAEFGDLQGRLAPHGDELARTGLPAMLPGDVPDYVRREALRMSRLPADDPEHMDSERAAEVAGSFELLSRDADLLTTGPIPLSLEHNDLHDNNAFVPSGDHVGFRFFDFGDAVWAHPFSSLLIPLNVMREEWNAGYDDPRLQRVVDAYLEAWSNLASRAELRELVAPAVRFGRIHRAESYRRLLVDFDETARAEYGRAPSFWLAKMAELIRD
jgi:Ser/Thr protein kinase RdoA (MazF antagonist)